MKIGIIGLQNSGKTTIFNALTGLKAETAVYSGGKVEPNLGTVEVKDPRVTKLSQMYEPKKTIYAHIEFIDFVGLSGSKESKEPFSSESMALIKTADALALVLRNFTTEFETEEPDPISDLEIIISELVISDLMIAEKRMEKIFLSLKRGIKDNALKLEEAALKKIISGLNEGIPILKHGISEEEEKIVRGFQFVTLKPIMIILNSDESNFNTNENLFKALSEEFKAIEFAGKFEEELNNLPEEEAREFMEDMNIKESARNRLTKFAYQLMGYISFFTVGKDEVRAWTITAGSTAVEAAGKIHTDLARGFIRGECFSYDDLIREGSEKNLRDKGLFRLEGKNYLVKDGEILHIRFNV
jgi:GTP-binding protein YchF